MIVNILKSRALNHPILTDVVLVLAVILLSYGLAQAIGAKWVLGFLGGVGAFYLSSLWQAQRQTRSARIEQAKSQYTNNRR